MAATEFRAKARAKVNLALHVTGQRADGYHLLDSLVVFAEVGDTVCVSQADALTLALDGPEAVALFEEQDNLVLRAARSLGSDKGALIRLTKHLPVSSGIGGGSADAAATLEALAALWERDLPDADAVLALGADVPVCLHGRTARLQGIGEQITSLAPVPGALVLVNPRVGVATPPVFRALERKGNPAMPAVIPEFPSAEALADWLAEQRNDLQAPAIALCPVISDVLAALEVASPLIARMSGSGATCFGLFPDLDLAKDAAERIRGAHPGWWVEAADIHRV